jgi:hypothetical protein
MLPHGPNPEELRQTANGNSGKLIAPTGLEPRNRGVTCQGQRRAAHENISD